jgi:hypothetical protein
MRILLVDDDRRHRQSGVDQLSALGHEVVAHSDYTDALREVKKGGVPFDVALLDLLMPAEATTLGTSGLAHFGKPIPVGYPLAVKLALLGVRFVGVATDTNHHDHPASAMMDWFPREPFRIAESTVLFVHAPLREDESKDWALVLEWLVRP